MYTNANMNTHVCVYENIYMNTTIQDYKRIDDIDVCLSICIYTYIRFDPYMRWEFSNRAETTKQ